jgi:hypothetical protein
MRGQASPQSAMFSYVSLEERIPASHPLRKLRVLVDPSNAAENLPVRSATVPQRKPLVQGPEPTT